MPIRPDELDGFLKSRGLPPVALVSGEEPLLTGECLDRLRHEAREQGFTEREVLNVESGFDWGRLAAAADNLSLFGDRRIVELRIPSGKPGQPGSKALVEFCGKAPPDVVLIVSTGRLDPAQRKGKWVQAIDRAGVAVQVWPIERDRLPRWLGARAQRLGLRPDPEALQLLAERAEGNLLAAAQELEKLRLLVGEGAVGADTVREVVADSARYTVFDLSEAVLAGDTRRTRRILQGLREEGEEPVLVLWALSREVRTIGQLSAPGGPGATEGFFRENRVFGPRKGLVQKAARRGRPAEWRYALARCAEADRVIKGAAPGSPWDELLQLGILIANIGAAKRGAA